MKSVVRSVKLAFLKLLSNFPESKQGFGVAFLGISHVQLTSPQNQERDFLVLVIYYEGEWMSVWEEVMKQ